MSKAKELNEQYLELCKNYGHLAYTKKSIEQQMKEMEQKMSVLAQMTQAESEKERINTLSALKKS